jgi:hypothetical protein
MPEASQDSTKPAPQSQNYYASLDTHSDATKSTIVGSTTKDFLGFSHFNSDSSHLSTDEEEDFEFPPKMSQATCAQFRKIQFFVEANLPERINDTILSYKEPLPTTRSQLPLPKKFTAGRNTPSKVPPFAAGPHPPTRSTPIPPVRFGPTSRPCTAKKAYT